MTKYFEVTMESQIDRYKLSNISIDHFLDTFVDPLLKASIEFKEVSEEYYEKDKKFPLEMNVEDLFKVEHYTYKHVSKEARNEWNKLIRQINR